MSVLMKWGEAHQLYDRAQRPRVIRELFAQTPWSRAAPYWVVALVYFGGSATLYFLYAGSGWVLGGLAVLAAIVLTTLEMLIQRDYAKLYEANGLHSIPFFQEAGI